METNRRLFDSLVGRTLKERISVKRIEAQRCFRLGEALVLSNSISSSWPFWTTPSDYWSGMVGASFLFTQKMHWARFLLIIVRCFPKEEGRRLFSSTEPVFFRQAREGRRLFFEFTQKMHWALFFHCSWKSLFRGVAVRWVKDIWGSWRLLHLILGFHPTVPLSTNLSGVSDLFPASNNLIFIGINGLTHFHH